MKTFFAIAALAAAGMASAQAPQPQAPQMAAANPSASASLTIRFEQITAPTGRILMSVYDSETAHDKGGKPARVGMVEVDGATATLTLTGLAPGRYAIKVFHDVDGDGQMKMNPFGMPLEPFAFSNGARPEGGPALWRAASFDVPAGASETRISFR
ncbi:DUF2141 domain-containing protein [Blastomonas sp. AAP25]|uniref:DUF2141 domain-containing protein n=1 Tax=Blastomonas sp. AAP25 TaxID=1523416 RepID=UPI0006B9DC53|nr:DUF2141 domain-containing protein [Blastomonas sp. AAP25]